MHFTKMQGLGNDYVYLDCTQGEPDDLPKLAVEMADRHFGVGSDGLICVCSSEKADFRMKMFNADGSEGEMCGNGIRCVGKFVYDKGLTEKRTVTIETLAGIKTLELTVEGREVIAATVDMGAPEIFEMRQLEIQGKKYEIQPVSMGNPHAVTFLNGIETLELTAIGPLFENHPSFPNAGVGKRQRRDVGLWDRGLCGTGGCGIGRKSGAVCRCSAVRGRLINPLGQRRWTCLYDRAGGHCF